MRRSSIDWRILEESRSRNHFKLTKAKELNADFGSVSLERVEIKPGLVANISEIHSRREFQLSADVTEQGDRICLQTTLTGTCRLDVREGISIRYRGGSSTAHAVRGTSATFTFPANSVLRTITCTYSRDELDNRLSGFVPGKFRNLLKDAGHSPDRLRRKNPAGLQRLVEFAFQERLTGPLRALQIDGVASILMAHLLDRSCSDPADYSGNTAPRRVKDAVFGIHDQILSDPTGLPDLDRLSRETGVNRKTLNAAFRSQFGTTIFGFAKAHRLDCARTRLLDGSGVLKEIAHEAGYAHVSNFVTAYKQRFGTTPGSETGGMGQA